MYKNKYLNKWIKHIHTLHNLQLNMLAQTNTLNGIQLICKISCKSKRFSFFFAFTVFWCHVRCDCLQCIPSAFPQCLVLFPLCWCIYLWEWQVKGVWCRSWCRCRCYCWWWRRWSRRWWWRWLWWCLCLCLWISDTGILEENIHVLMNVLIMNISFTGTFYWR